MTATIEAPTLNETLPRKRFTRDEVHQLLDLGFFAGQRYELIDGDLIDKMGQKRPHQYGIIDLHALLLEIVAFRRIRNQMPFSTEGADYSISEPEPDLAVLADGDPNRFRDVDIRGCDLALVVEISDTSRRQDLIVKRDLYARSGVREYWVLDLTGRRLVVHRKPNGGQYGDILILAADATVEFEGATLPIARMLPNAAI